MANLADILVTLTLDTSEFSDRLRDVGQELNDFRNHVRQVTSNMSADFSASMGDMSSSMNIITQATQEASNSVNQNMDSVSESINSTAMSSRTLARTLGTDVFDSFSVLSAGVREFDNFQNAGTRASLQIREQFAYLPRHLQNYVQRLTDAGQSTESFARLNEQYGQRVVESMRRTNDYMQQRTMQSTSIINALRDQNIQPLSQQFLRLGQRLEDNARKGSALNLALTQLGENASPKAIADRMKLITQGVTRATQVMMYMGIVTGLAIYGLIQMSNEVDGRLKPAFAELKSVWLDALTPFVKAFTTFVVWIMKGATAVGMLMKKFAEAHPQLSQMFWGFILLTMALTTLLAPLAVGIGLTGGLSAGFAVLWTTIAPFVLGFLTVAGVAVLLAGAIVVLTAVIHNMWNASKALRDSWNTMWAEIKDTIVTAFVEPVMMAWERLKVAFSNLIATVTGGTGTMGNLWKWLGDKVAVVVNAIAGFILPILHNALIVLTAVVVGAINGIVVVLNWLASMWKANGSTITAVLTLLWGYIMTAFNAIRAYIVSIMPQIMSIITTTFQTIQAIIGFVMTYIAPVVVAAFKVIMAIILMVMPFVLQLIVSTWNNIKTVISSALAIIQNVIALFGNILKGNWKGVWSNIKAIVSNAVTLIWNLIQLWFLGKFLAPFRGFASAGKSLVKSAWTGFLSIIRGILTSTKAFIVGVWNAIKSSLAGSFNGIRSLATSTFNGLKSTVTSIFNGIKSTATTVWNAVKTAITKPIETAKNTVLKIIGSISKAFASMDITIPKPKLPKVNVSMAEAFGGKIKYPKFSVSWNAKGNIFNGASILGGGQGVGEAGAEAVMPISHKRYMRPYASSVASHLSKMMKGSDTEKSAGGNQYQIQFNEPVVIREDADIQRIVDELERRRKISERAKGVFSF